MIENMVTLLIVQIITFIALALIFYSTGLFKEETYYYYYGGRLNRFAFFKKSLIWLLVFIILGVPLTALISMLPITNIFLKNILYSIVIGLFYFKLATFIIKRLHDLELSGKYFVGYFLLTNIFSIIMLLSFKQGPESELFSKLSFLATIISLIQLAIVFTIFLMKGTKGENKYGSDPLEKSIEYNNEK